MNTYLDHNATAPLRPAVADAMADALARVGNASSVHRFGRLARRAIEDAREAVAALVGAEPGEVVFTSGGTEANNLALAGVPDGAVMVSAVEHDSVRAVRPGARSLPVDGDGVVDLAALEAALSAVDAPALVSVMAANNETGVIQPIAAVGELAHAYGARLHCDAVQAAGKLPLDMAALGIDLMTVSAHKLGGPQGIGALVIGNDCALEPLIVGGGQERRRRAGTENVAAITGFGVAAALAGETLAEFAHLAALRDDIEARACRAVARVAVHGAGAPRLANTTCIGLADVSAEVQVIALDLAGIAVSAGAACSSGKMAPSHVLRAMGLGEAAATNAIRVSLGWSSTPADAERFIAEWTAMARRMGSAATPARSVA